MAQYINKSDLVAELERRRDLHFKSYIEKGFESFESLKGKYDEDGHILSLIDNLETKEVDLSWKDIRLIAEIGEEFMNSEESDAYADDEEAYYTAILNKLKENGSNYITQRQRIRDIQAKKGK